MSSIYRKGRDGYFYYQTYIKNKNSGKMDKRIYHSLRTKDEDKAKNLKEYYDKLYVKNKKIRNKLLSTLYLNKKIFFTSSSIMFFLITFTLMTNKKVSAIELFANDHYEYDHKNNLQQSNKKSLNEEINKKISILVPVSKNTTLVDTAKPRIKIDLENFVIQREESIFRNFEQGNIFITTKYNQPEELKSLCKMIKEQFNQYSSIIISVYKDNNEGISIAKGIVSSTESDFNNDTWLAMYTFHPAEGEFFDSKPNIYHQKY